MAHKGVTAMNVSHTVFNVRKVSESRYVFDSTVEFANGSVFDWQLRDCTLVKGARAGDWIVFGPSRWHQGTFKELVSIPFPVMTQMRESVLDAISERDL